jgi:hypothetical protein
LYAFRPLNAPSIYVNKRPTGPSPEPSQGNYGKLLTTCPKFHPLDN